MANNGRSQPETPWQNGVTTVSSMVATLLFKQEFCDVTFRVGADVQLNPEDFPCHRAVVAARSTVFATMFFGSLPENKAVVEVKDILPIHFGLMVKYIYTNDVSGINRDNLFAMYAVAHIYDIVPLMQFCAGHVKKCISMESVGKFLTMRDLYEDSVIAQHCDKFLKTNAWKLFQKEEYYMELSQNHLVEIWKRDDMWNSRRALPEIRIYFGAMRWARRECMRKGFSSSHTNLREILGEAVALFCFPRMSLDQFNKFVKPGGLLTWEEIAEMVLYMANVPNVEVPVGRPFPDRSAKSLPSDTECVRLSDGRLVNIHRDLLKEAIAGTLISDGHVMTPQRRSMPSTGTTVNGTDDPSVRQNTVSIGGGNR